MTRRQLLRTAAIAPVAAGSGGGHEALRPAACGVGRSVRGRQRAARDRSRRGVRAPHARRQDSVRRAADAAAGRPDDGRPRHLEPASITRRRRVSSGTNRRCSSRITTKNGLVGWGECHSPSAPRMHQRIISDLFAPLLRGQDARWINRFGSACIRRAGTWLFHWRTFEALAGVDLALWDLLGHALRLRRVSAARRQVPGRHPDVHRRRRHDAGAAGEERRKRRRARLKVVKMGFRKGEGTGTSTACRPCPT